MSIRPPHQRHQWEAVVAAGFTLDQFRRRCRTMAETLAARNWTCLVGCDTRFLGSQLALDAYRTLRGAGVSALLVTNSVPFPAIEMALEQQRADCALLVSAGDRPYWMQGLIALTPQLDQSPIAPAASAPDGAFPEDSSESTERALTDLRPIYIEQLRAGIEIEVVRRSPLTIFIDPMYGSAAGIVSAVIGDGAQAKAIEINRDPDPLFGRQTPEPVTTNLVRLRKLVRESNAHFGAALSADGRAISLIDGNGAQLTPTQVGMLLGYHFARHQRRRGLVIVPDVQQQSETEIRNWEGRTGLKLDREAAPARKIGEIVQHDRQSLLVGVTAAGEVYQGRGGIGPDAARTALLTAECVARAGVPLADLMRMLGS